MATSPSTEAADIRRRGRHRLIGAIAIVAVLVIFVPMVFDSEPRAPQPEPSLEIPAKDKAPALAPPAPAVGQAKQAEAAPPAKELPQPATAKEPTPKLEGFAVQVGAFRDEEKLKQARAKLSAAGVAHYIERRETPTGELTRLRAGPFPTREAADKALAAVKAASLDGQVVPLP
jgi:DedD protein